MLAPYLPSPTEERGGDHQMEGRVSIHSSLSSIVTMMKRMSGGGGRTSFVQFELEDRSRGDGSLGAAPGDDSTPRVSLDIPRQFSETRERLSMVLERRKKGGDVAVETVEDLKKELEMDEHRIDMSDLCARFNTDLDKGLSTENAARRLEMDGPNVLSPPRQIPEWVKFLKQLTGFFSLLLWLGGILCFVSFFIDSESTDNLYLGIVLILVVFITGLFSYLQEAKSARVMEGFRRLLPTMTTVVRNGEHTMINATNLVLGDIIEITAGNKVPADIRIVQEHNFKVDNSSLTGESEAQSRSTEMTDENPLETKNLAFCGTLAVEGRAKAMIIRAGDTTVIGRIAGLASQTRSETTPIHREIDHFVKIISAVAITLGISFFIIGFIKGTDVVQNVVFAIGIIVANVPEGLLATVTVSLTLTAKRMASKHVLVKNLESVETLGSTTTIASDKTGTLTQNRMTVAHLWYNDEVFTADTSVSKGSYEKTNESFRALHQIAALCNRASFDPDDVDTPLLLRKTIGDATESALIRFAEPLRSVSEYRDTYRKVAEIPFNSTNKWQLSIHKTVEAAESSHIIVMKGAPERIIDRCSHIMLNGEIHPLDETQRRKFQEAYDTLGGMGERVLGFAQLPLPRSEFADDFEFNTDKTNFPMEGLTFVGLISLIDPPRETVPEAVRKCKEAGIRVIMVTGDHPTTAKAIAKQVGIITGDTEDDIAKREGIPVEQVERGRARGIVVHGGEMKDLQPEDWDFIMNHPEIVFARTSPQQKLLIVEACQNRNEIVAVTGDGVNDSPALKKADIGVAMGIAGSDVSKEAADMILLDDNFASIVNGVEEGRLIFDNLKKSIAYTLSSNIPEIFPFLAFITLGLPLPLTTVLILCIDLGTDMIPAISLAYELPELDIMRRRPRNAKTDRLVTSRLISFSYLQIGLIQAMAGFFTYFVVLYDQGFNASELFGLADGWEEEDRGLICKLDSDDKFTGCKYQDGCSTVASGFDVCLTEGMRDTILKNAQTAYFVSIIIVQWGDLLICKTRKLSLLQQRMVNNVLSFGLCSETLLGIFLCYTPFLRAVFGTRAIKFIYWLPGLIFSALEFVYDESRKLYIRLHPGGWVESNTYW